MKYIRQRYILFEVLSKELAYLSEKSVIQAIWNQMIKLFGEFKTFQVGLWMIRWDKEMKIGIIRCDNLTKYEVISSLALIKRINNNIPVIFHTRKTSGTIKKTLKSWKKYFETVPPKRNG